MDEERIAKLEAELKAELKAKAADPEPFKPKVYPKFDPTEGMGMPGSAVKPMVDLIPDVKGQKYDPSAWARTKIGEPGFLPASKSPPVERGSGWVKPMDHASPSGLRYIDQAMDVQDRLDKIELERRLKGR